MSDGSRSMVNWMRAKARSIVFARVATRSVFARPGTPCSSRCPPVNRATSTRSTTSWPTTTSPMRERTFCREVIVASRSAGGVVMARLGAVGARRDRLPHRRGLVHSQEGDAALLALFHLLAQPGEVGADLLRVG